MEKKVIVSEKSPAAIGPYSQAIEYNGIVYTSGVIGVNPATGEVGETIEEQTTQVFENLKGLLADAGSSLDQAIKTTVFIKNMDDFAKVNEIYATYFRCISSTFLRGSSKTSKRPLDRSRSNCDQRLINSMLQSGIIELDVHSMNRAQAKTYIDSQLKRAKKDIYQIKVIHGYRGGTAIRDMVRKTYRNHPKVVRVELPLNPGETNLILKEYF